MYIRVQTFNLLFVNYELNLCSICKNTFFNFKIFLYKMFLFRVVFILTKLIFINIFLRRLLTSKNKIRNISYFLLFKHSDIIKTQNTFVPFTIFTNLTYYFGLSYAYLTIQLREILKVSSGKSQLNVERRKPLQEAVTYFRPKQHFLPIVIAAFVANDKLID